jgi:uncharacterized membrane protein YbaN (DUF454 family)
MGTDPLPSPPGSARARSRTKRLAYLVLGWLFFAIGAIGAVLPVLPTTPFMILALWAFSRSSQRFHAWLYDHRLFGPGLHQWQDNRVIPRSVKLTAFTGMLASLTMMVMLSVAWPALLGAVLVMAAGAVFIARCPSFPPR